MCTVLDLLFYFNEYNYSKLFSQNAVTFTIVEWGKFKYSYKGIAECLSFQSLVLLFCFDLQSFT